MSNLDEIYIETPNGQIYGRAAGKPGNLLILGLHGWSQRNGWHTWQPFLKPLDDAGYYAVSVDLPGWGKSRSWGKGPATTEIVKSAILAILEGLEYDAAVLMGKSWGGGIAIQIALDDPQKVVKLVLTAPAYGNIDRLRELNQPVLLAWSRDDPVIPFNFSAVYEKYISDLQTAYYDVGGHSAAMENANDFIPILSQFLKHS